MIACGAGSPRCRAEDHGPSQRGCAWRSSMLSCLTLLAHVFLVRFSFCFAYACVTGEWLLVTELLQKVNQANTRAKERGYRCYKDWSEYNQRFLKPCLTLPSTPNTCFLIHADVGGAPRCFGAKVLPDGQLQIFHERKACTLPILSLEEILAQTCETFSVVFFSVHSVKPEMTASEVELLDLVAGCNSNRCLFTDRRGGGEAS